MATSSIEWTEQTWNPTTGCTKISQGCKFCYAQIMTRRLKAMGQVKYQAGFDKIVTHPSELTIPLRRRKPTTWFVDSMSDLFHKDVPMDFIEQVFDVMAQGDWHTFQVLTKRSERMWSLSPFLNWSPNVWMGVSVENDAHRERIDHLRNSGARVKFLSLEPLLGPLPDLNLTGIHWVIVGGESGRNPRPIQIEWVEDIRRQCERARVAFFFKQWGGINKKLSGRTLDGHTYEQMPGHYETLPLVV